jgi:hypothetical protein
MPQPTHRFSVISGLLSTKTMVSFLFASADRILATP